MKCRSAGGIHKEWQVSDVQCNMIQEWQVSASPGRELIVWGGGVGPGGPLPPSVTDDASVHAASLSTPSYLLLSAPNGY